MKKQSNLKQYKSEDLDEIFDVMKKCRKVTDKELYGYPFSYTLLSLLDRTNPLKKRYYYLEEDFRYAFFVVYENHMNLLTYGTREWYMDVQTIGFPCSLSCPGFITNDVDWLLRYIKTIPGCKLVLNVNTCNPVPNMSIGETLPTCVLKGLGRFPTADAYLYAMRSSYRRRIRLAIKRCAGVYKKEVSGEAASICHGLYLQTYEHSDYKLECLDEAFFREVDATRILFYKEDRPVGFVLLKLMEERVLFLFCGMDYSYEKHADLYYCMLYHIVEYAITRHAQSIDFGQTSERTKLSFGAETEKRYFYAHHTNPFLNLVAILGKRILSYSYQFPDYHVFRSEASDKKQ